MKKEEYRRVHERIGENEKRRYQTFAICLAGFAAVIGFGRVQGGINLIPPGLAAVFVLCSREYMSQSILQRINSAFVAAKYEASDPDLNYASMDAGVSYGGFLSKLMAYILSPMHILSIISIAGAAYFTAKAVSGDNPAVDITTLWGWIYVAGVAVVHGIGYGLIVYDHRHGLSWAREHVDGYLSQ